MRSGDRFAMLDLDSAAQVLLTSEGRRLLSERVRVLRVEVLPQLRSALEDPERDGRVEAEFDRVVEELRRLTWVVDHAAIAEDLVGESAVVELGTVVTVRVGQGVLERFLIVHPIEAPLDELRISARSPLAQALLGHRVGEEVEVAAPAGSYRCRIVAVKGPPVGPGAAPSTLDTTQ